MRVLLVAEKEGTAIHRLCVQLTKYCTWHSFKIVCVHPKRPSAQQLQDFQEGLTWCDVVDFEYWRTAEVLHSMFDIKKPALLSHHNPYDLERADWSKYKINVVSNTEQQHSIRMPSTRIDLPVDLDFWKYQEKEPSNPLFDIILVQNRIEGKKGALEVAIAAKELGLSVALVGDISDPDYMAKIMDTGVVEFFQRISDGELLDLYHQSKIHICNSTDNFESGTLPILEAMACGTPVLTRKIGHVPDLFNGRNMQVRRGEVSDIEDLKTQISELMNNKELRDEIRAESRHSLRYRNYEIYARKYSKLYHSLLQPKELVTAIIPTVSSPEQLSNTLSHVMAQGYGPMEIIVVDDSDKPEINEELVKNLVPLTPHTIKFFRCATYAFDNAGNVTKTYGLARARNKAILESEGQWLWFVDDRMLPASDSLERFYDRRKEQVWLWGMKDKAKKSFVENFSFCNRKDLVLLGGFNEQITQYGGMTQECRSRWEGNHNTLEFVSDAECSQQKKASSKWKRIAEIAKSKTQCYKLYG